MIYLASPYSDPNPVVERQRFEAVCHAAAILMAEGHRIFSPIAHTHPIAMAGDLPRGWEYWRKYDEEMLAACDELWILMLPGWDKSAGIAGELEIVAQSKLVKYIDPREWSPDAQGEPTAGQGAGE